jgi:putative acetyltransferase
MIVRPERATDTEAIATVVADALDDVNIARLVAKIRGSEHYVPELALVADVDGEVAGHIMLSYATLVGAAPRPVLLLSPLAVTPARQRQGIGAALVHAALERADGLGEPLVIVEGIPAYYPRFGFERARAHGIEAPSPTVPEEALMVRKLSAYRDDLRGRVVFPPAFDDVVAIPSD